MNETDRDTERFVKISARTIRRAVEIEGKDVPERFDLVAVRGTDDPHEYKVHFVDHREVRRQHVQRLREKGVPFLDE